MRMPGDLVLQGLISSVFWLSVFAIAVLAFRRELRGLLRSLTTLKVAGASFVLSDRKSTLESYAVLADILVDILSKPEAAPRVRELLTKSNGAQLAKVLVKYEDEVPEEDWNREFLRNAARVVGWTGHYDVSLKFFDRLLRKRKDDTDLLIVRADLLNDSGLAENLAKAKVEFEKLLGKLPNNPWVRFSYATNLSRLGDHENCITELDLLPTSYWQQRPKALENRHLAAALQAASQDRVEALRNKVDAVTGRSS
jgi:predicted Zn-dependent protease